MINGADLEPFDPSTYTMGSVVPRVKDGVSPMSLHPEYLVPLLGRSELLGGLRIFVVCYAGSQGEGEHVPRAHKKM